MTRRGSSRMIDSPSWTRYDNDLPDAFLLIT